ncbi:uncharacterized protein [Maniola hyperantus]|uniref:uncharacterized protein isoform X3 n=1 Tax=Aphantopus hyperantus TaxID=2795564 RepID=UPI0037498D57
MQPRILTFLILAFGCLYSGECQSLSCPKVRTTSGWLDLFPIPCRKSTECTLMGTQHLCCKGFCTKGVIAQAIRTTTTTTTTTTTPKPTTTTTEPPRPFLQLLPIQLAPTAAPAKIGKTQKLACPKNPAGGLFPIPCESNAQCRASSGPGQVCCKGQCVKGVPAPRPVSEESHQPILGVIPRECPTAPLGELLFEVQTCKADSDCWPRVCCPDGTRSYCRTARARLDLVPVANRIEAPVRMLESYLQCTAPPKFDSFPQRCSSSIDCFPNLCCAEGGKKHCRPPQRSLFALLAGAAARLG